MGTALIALSLAAVGASATTASAATATGRPSAATSCAVGWGSADKVGEVADYARPLVNVRAGRHDCYDRLVLDVRGTGDRPIGFRVGYVDELHQDGSGDLVPVGGGAILSVRIAAPSYDPDTFKPVYNGKVGERLPGVDVTGYRTFRDTRFGGSFEGDSLIGLGVRARLPFRVTQTPTQVIVDVAHSWTAAAR
ncbi:hypothetical protein [Streptomyces sp. NPDC003077]|uniref:AMIN-like domain-containing (lipo)protein n=1 Tax=Streptomyces sp. NPDC003077 TaxID=3154443 RepID=UPI0033BD6735